MQFLTTMLHFLNRDESSEGITGYICKSDTKSKHVMQMFTYLNVVING